VNYSDAAPLSAPTTSAMIKVIFMKLSLEIASTFAPSIVETGMENSGASVFCLPLNSITFSSLFIAYLFRIARSSGYGLFATIRASRSTSFHGHIAFRISTQFSITFSNVAGCNLLAL
jgi:hypothetical protein